MIHYNHAATIKEILRQERILPKPNECYSLIETLCSLMNQIFKNQS